MAGASVTQHDTWHMHAQACPIRAHSFRNNKGCQQVSQPWQTVAPRQHSFHVDCARDVSITPICFLITEHGGFGPTIMDDSSHLNEHMMIELSKTPMEQI